MFYDAGVPGEAESCREKQVTHDDAAKLRSCLEVAPKLTNKCQAIAPGPGAEHRTKSDPNWPSGTKLRADPGPISTNYDPI